MPILIERTKMIDRELVRSFMYVLHPRIIRSINDWEYHFINYSQLVALWGIPSDRWVTYDYYSEHYLDTRKYIVLGPDPTGRYDLEAKIQKHLVELY